MEDDYNAAMGTRSMLLHRGHTCLKVMDAVKKIQIHQSEFHNHLHYKYFTYLMEDTLSESQFC